MAIFRRILRKFYMKRNFQTHKKSINKIKSRFNYNKFLPKTLKIKKFKKNLMYRTLDIKYWNNFSPEIRKTEYAFAQRDIHIFANQYIPKLHNSKAETTFQAYLPQNIWNKMTKQQRREHLNKRNFLSKKGVKFIKHSNKKTIFKAYFTNLKLRPWIKNINVQAKLKYLRALIARAKIRSTALHREITPKISEMPAYKKTNKAVQHLLNFKKTVVLNKKTNFKNKIFIPAKPSKNLYRAKNTKNIPKIKSKYNR